MQREFAPTPKLFSMALYKGLPRKKSKESIKKTTLLLPVSQSSSGIAGDRCWTGPLPAAVSKPYTRGKN